MTSALPRPLRSFLDASRYYAAGIWKRANEVPIFIWAQAIAFKVLVTILPLILIATGVFGLVLRQENPFDTVAEYLRSFLPPGQNEGLISLLYQLQESSQTITIFGALFLLVTVVTLFSVLRYIVATAIGDRHTYRPILGGYVFDVRMAIQVGLLFLLSFGLTVALNIVSAESTAVLSGWGFDPALLRRGWRLVLRAVTILVPYSLSVLMFMQLFYFIPRPSPPSRSAFFGAAVSAVLFEVAKNGFTLYATYSGRFDFGGAEAESGSTGAAALGGLGGVFGLLLLFVFWIYFSGLVLIIGAIMTGLHERRNKPERSRLRRYFTKLFDRPKPEAAPEGSPEPEGAPAASPPRGPAEAAGDGADVSARTPHPGP
jgi:membrane protein